ncbi:hypothetical protein KAR52_00620 [Candidatus Pacearchaeota archaeon]|nr:hypothetical protein [Candidatus Pacearchaeota archaeon]
MIREELEFPWILQLPKKDLGDLTMGETRKFSELGARIYPLKKLFFLVDEEFNAQAMIKIGEYSLKSSGASVEISGEYTVLHVFDEIEEKVLTDLFNRSYNIHFKDESP